MNGIPVISHIASLLAAKAEEEARQAAHQASYAFQHPIANMQGKSPYASEGTYLMIDGKPTLVNASTIPFFGGPAGKIAKYLDAGQAPRSMLTTAKDVLTRPQRPSWPDVKQSLFHGPDSTFGGADTARAVKARVADIPHRLGHYADSGPKNKQDLLDIHKPMPNIHDFSKPRMLKEPAGSGAEHEAMQAAVKAAGHEDVRRMKSHMALLMIKKMGRNK